MSIFLFKLSVVKYLNFQNTAILGNIATNNNHNPLSILAQAIDIKIYSYVAEDL